MELPFNTNGVYVACMEDIEGAFIPGLDKKTGKPIQRKPWEHKSEVLGFINKRIDYDVYHYYYVLSFFSTPTKLLAKQDDDKLLVGGLFMLKGELLRIVEEHRKAWFWEVGYEVIQHVQENKELKNFGKVNFSEDRSWIIEFPKAKIAGNLVYDYEYGKSVLKVVYYDETFNQYIRMYMKYIPCTY